MRPSIEIAAPLVGRWMELSRLDLAYQSARLGRTELVLIAGEPGIGKSRLVSEFIGLATSAEEGAQAADAPRVMRWTFSRVNQRSYAGFIEPIRVELHIEPSDPDAIMHINEKLLELGFTNPPSTVAPMLAQFLHLPGVSEPASDSEEWKRSMYITVYDVIAALARQHPLLYVLEDLHFADAASLDLLWFLTSRASRVPILFLLAQRLGPGSPEPKPSRTNFSQMVLEPLSDEEAARIVEATLDWVPDELRDRIVARAGGNPFFIEESLRSLVESGAAEKDAGGEWHLRERPAALEVPATLHAVVAARIDRLPPTARECIQMAAVIGTRFGDRVLRAAGGDRIADAVDQLIAADLVILNKADLVSDADLAKIESHLRAEMRPGTGIVRARNGHVDVAALLGMGLSTEDNLAGRDSHHELEHGGEAHEHDDFDSFSVRLDSVVSKDHLLKTIEQTIRAHDVLRLKGFAALPGATARLAIQAVGPRVSAYFDRPWKPGEVRETALVVIGEQPLDRAAITASLMRGAAPVIAAE